MARIPAEHLPNIAQIQLADNPGRHEPGTGEINSPLLLEHLDRIDCGEWGGCEYRPSGRTADGFGWLRRAGRGATDGERAQ